MNNNLPAIADRQADVKKALTAIGENHPKELEVIKNFLNLVAMQDIRVLGQNELFVIRSADGKAVSVKRKVRLSITDGTLIKLGSKPDSPVIMTAVAFERLSEAANIVVINPPEVMVDGKSVNNPHLEYDANGLATRVHSRSVAMGYTATGIPAISDRTCIFDIDLYRMVDLLAKAKYNQTAFKLLPVGMKPEGKGTWAEYKFDGSTALWVDTSHKDAITWYAQNVNRQKKAIEFAQTFSSRNAVKHHPAIAMQRVPDGTATYDAEVFGWLQVEGHFKWNMAAYAEMADKAGEIADGNVIEENIQVIEGKDDIGIHNDGENDITTAMDIEDIVEEEENQASDEQPPGPTPQTQKQTEPAPESEPVKEQDSQPAAHDSNARKKLNAAIQSVGDDYYQQARANIGIPETIKTLFLDDQQCETIVTEMNSVLDKELGEG